MIIVTSGMTYLDIDAYAGIVAYAELLNKLGHDAKAVSLAPLNESITPKLRNLEVPLETAYEPSPDDTFIMIDVSEPDYFDSFVDLERVTEVIDHHPGFERYWQRLGEGYKIEFIGAACTLVYEEWMKAGKFDEMSDESAILLVSGILDNTLNFNAGVSTKRDEEAYSQLIAKAGSEYESWPAEYFTDCQASIEADVRLAVRNDAKMTKGTAGLPQAFGQLVVWNAQTLLQNHRDEIMETMAGMSDDWAMNLVSIEEGFSYFLADNRETQHKFGKLMDVDLSRGLVAADKLYLRKEILKKAGF